MSQVRRHDLGTGSDATVTDNTNTFKKDFQTIGRPQVTESDMHEEYMRNPPNASSLPYAMEQGLTYSAQNQPYEPNNDRKHPGIKEGAWQYDPELQPGQKVLGDEGIGRVKKGQALQEQTEEGSVHPHNPTG